MGIACGSHRDKSNRRDVLKCLLGLWMGLGAAKAADSKVGWPIFQFAAAPPPAARTIFVRRYRARAVVTFFSVPIFTKDGVGAGCAMVEELTVPKEASSERITTLQFSGGSWPERLRGFNRFGITQEAAREQAGTLSESAYVSFMTSSPEKNNDDARRAFLEHPNDLSLTVARGAASRSGYRCTVDHTAAPAGSTYMDCPRLMDRFRERPWPEPSEQLAERVFPTFLHSVRQAMASGEAARSCSFMHNARIYELRTRLSTVMTAFGRSSLLVGRIVEPGAGSGSEFHVTFDPKDPALLPHTIEFRPKSFLRLVFEQDPAAGGPTLHTLTSPENA